MHAVFISLIFFPLEGCKMVDLTEDDNEFAIEVAKVQLN